MQSRTRGWLELGAGIVGIAAGLVILAFTVGGGEQPDGLVPQVGATEHGGPWFLALGPLLAGLFGVASGVCRLSGRTHAPGAGGGSARVCSVARAESSGCRVSRTIQRRAPRSPARDSDRKSCARTAASSRASS